MSLSIWSKAWTWIKSKWKWIVGFVVGLITLLSVMMRSRQQKKVLEAANKAHEKENKINEKAKDDLVTGLAKISEDKDKKIEEALIESDKKKKDLQKEKEGFVEESANSEDLGRKIADLIGADYVEADDE
jgi:flagellar biosynthesis/type III secretory pathway M-ring protein FliF/YscJ